MPQTTAKIRRSSGLKIGKQNLISAFYFILPQKTFKKFAEHEHTSAADAGGFSPPTAEFANCRNDRKKGKSRLIGERMSETGSIDARCLSECCPLKCQLAVRKHPSVNPGFKRPSKAPLKTVADYEWKSIMVIMVMTGFFNDRTVVRTFDIFG